MPKRATSVDDPLILEAALEGLELQKQRIEAQMAQIRSRLGKRPRAAPPPEPAGPARRSLSAEARKRIAAAQKKRWAEYRKSNVGPK